VIEITQYHGDGTRGGNEFVKSICLGQPDDFSFGCSSPNKASPEHNEHFVPLEDLENYQLTD